MAIEEMNHNIQEQKEEGNSWIMGMRFGFILLPIEVEAIRNLMEENVVGLVEMDSMSIRNMGTTIPVVIENMDTLDVQGTIPMDLIPVEIEGEGEVMDRIEVVEEEVMVPEMTVMVDPEVLPMEVEVGEVQVVEVVPDIFHVIIGILVMFHGKCHLMIRVEIVMTGQQEIGIVLEEIGIFEDRP